MMDDASRDARSLREFIFRVVQMLPKGEAQPCAQCGKPSSQVTIIAQPYRTCDTDFELSLRLKHLISWLTVEDETIEEAARAGVRMRTFAYYVCEVESGRTSVPYLMTLPVPEGEDFQDMVARLGADFRSYVTDKKQLEFWYDAIERLIEYKRLDPFKMSSD